MGDDKAGPALHQPVHGVLNLLFRSGIHRGCGLVQNHDLIVREDGSGDREKLLLALRYVAGILVQLHLIAAGKGLYEAVGMSRLRRRNDFLIRGVQPAVADVFHNGALKQPGILKHHTEHLPQLASVDPADIRPVHQNLAAVHIVETHEQLHHGGFARSGGADDCHRLAGFYGAVEIMDDDLIRVVPEGHVGKFHRALRIGKMRRILHRLFLLFLLQEFKHSLRCCRCGLKHVGNLSQLSNGLGKVSHVLDKGLDISHIDGPAHRQHAAQNGDRHIAQISHKGHDGLHQPGQKLGFPGGLVKDFIGGMEGILHILFLIKSLHDIVAAVDLLHLTVDLAQIFLLRHEEALGFLHQKPGEPCGNRQDDDGDQGHQRADAQHHDEHADHGGDRSDELGDALVQALPQGIHIVGDAGKHLAHRPAFKIFHGHPVDLRNDLPAETIGQILRNLRHNQALNERQQGA